jgi:MFS family permease
MGRAAGLFLANLAILACSAISGDQFITWGWRMPFWLSLILVAIGLWIRLTILETPVFSRLVAEARVERAPALEVLKRQSKEVILTALARTGQMAPAFVYSAFFFTYGTMVVGASRNFLLIALLIASLVSLFTIPISGYLSNRLGRKQVYLLAQ